MTRSLSQSYTRKKQFFGEGVLQQEISNFIMNRTQEAVDTVSDVQNQLGVREELEQRAIDT